MRRFQPSTIIGFKFSFNHVTKAIAAASEACVGVRSHLLLLRSSNRAPSDATPPTTSPTRVWFPRLASACAPATKPQPAATLCVSNKNGAPRWLLQHGHPSVSHLRRIPDCLIFLFNSKFFGTGPSAQRDLGSSNNAVFKAYCLPFS